MTSTEKKCCDDCYSDEADCNNSCPCHSEKPVQDVKGFFEGKLIRFTPDTEEWEKEWERVADIYDLSRKARMMLKGFIRLTLQDEREKVKKELGVYTKPHQRPEDFVEDGIQAERQRIEDAVEGLRKEVPSLVKLTTITYKEREEHRLKQWGARAYNAALDAVLRIIKGEDKGTERA